MLMLRGSGPEVPVRVSALQCHFLRGMQRGWRQEGWHDAATVWLYQCRATWGSRSTWRSWPSALVATTVWLGQGAIRKAPRLLRGPSTKLSAINSESSCMPWLGAEASCARCALSHSASTRAATRQKSQHHYLKEKDAVVSGTATPRIVAQDEFKLFSAWRSRVLVATTEWLRYAGRVGMEAVFRQGR
jgi:hypothetical protein